MLEFKKVHFSVGPKIILKDISFKIIPGEMVAVLGESGAGKSSIFRLLIGEKKPSLGKITIDETSLGDLSFDSIQRYRRQIGVVFQDFRLLQNKTVAENVSFALEACGEGASMAEKVPALLKLVGLWDKKDRFPQEISGGEKQRVCIARALIHDPQILIADEPTGNLDPKNAREIGELFQKLNEKMTIIFATHDPLLVGRLKPRVIKLTQGQLSHDEKFTTIDRAFEGLL